MSKKLTAMLFAALAALGAWAETETVDGIEWTYRVTDGGAEISSISKSTSGAITVPSRLGGYTVTSVGHGAFQDCRSLTKVTISKDVTSIGSWAFSDCRSLVSVKIPDNVTSIGSSAFSDCLSLTSVTLPNKVSIIESWMFHNCHSLTSVTIGKNVTSIESLAFCNCSSLMSITIPNGVTIIGSSAFSDCTRLTNVKMPDSVTIIESSAFHDCRGLTNVIIGSSVTSIGSSAFSGCSSLESVKIPDSVTSIESFAFFNCEGLTNITLPKSVTSIGSSAFNTWNELHACYVSNGDVERIKTLLEESGLDTSDIIFVELPCLILKPSNTKYGIVDGGGLCEPDAEIMLKATAKSGYVFVGWFTDKACKKPLNPEGYDNRNSTVKYTMLAKNTTIYAKFVTKADDKKALKFSSATAKLAKTPAKATAGDAFSLGLELSSASLPTFAAKGLPKGLKIDKATGEITGKATVPGSYTATVTVKDAAGNGISQKVKFKVSAPSWATGAFYGTARPDGKTAAYLQFAVSSTGKVSGKVNFKGKAYSFKSTLSSCTASEAAFTPSVKIGKATFKPGAVTIRETENAGGWLVEAANKKGTFTGQKKANLVKKDKALAALVGKSFTFTKKTKNSGLTKSGDKLKVKLADGDKVTASGTVNGKKLTALSAPLIVSEVSALDGMTTYTLYADILDAKTKYYKTVVFTVKVPVVLNPVPEASAAFAK